MNETESLSKTQEECYEYVECSKQNQELRVGTKTIPSTPSRTSMLLHVREYTVDVRRSSSMDEAG